MAKTNLPARKYFLKSVYNAVYSTTRKDWSFQGESSDGKGRTTIGFFGWDDGFEEYDGVRLMDLMQKSEDSYGAKLWNKHAQNLVDNFETTDGVILCQARNEKTGGLKYYHSIYKILFTVSWKGSTYAVCGQRIPAEQLYENRQFAEEVVDVSTN